MRAFKRVACEAKRQQKHRNVQYDAKDFNKVQKL